jgi:putative N6-adenine-specific DNA methylase
VPAIKPRIVVANPPWGLRIGAEDHEETWAQLGAFLKEQCGGATAWLLSGSPELTKPLRMRAEQRVPIRIAQVDARFIRYTVRDREEIL